MPEQLPPPGWYAAPHANNEQRYWDGSRWLEAAPAPAMPLQAEQYAAHTTVASSDAQSTPAKAPMSGRTKALIACGSIVAAALVISGIGSAVSGGSKSDPVAVVEATPTSAPAEEVVEQEPVMVAIPDVTGMTVRDAIVAITAAGLSAPVPSSFEDLDATVTSSSPAAATSVQEFSDVTFIVQEKPKLTLGQQNAIGKAKNYLSFAGFSRTGLIDQLEFEGFSTEEATFGADNAGADWNAECAEKAKSYIDMTSFSRQGLYDQLAFEGFQASEIDFGLAAVGY